MLRIDVNCHLLSPAVRNASDSDEPSTPLSSPRHQPERQALLSDTLGREDLFTLCNLMDTQFGHYNWALTGSVALMIHAHDIGTDGLIFSRTPSDADILVDECKLRRFGYHGTGLKDECVAQGLTHYDNKTEVLQLARGDGKEPLEVDLIKSGSKGFGNLGNGGSILVQGVPVLKLESLKHSLERRLDNGESGPNSTEDLKLVKQLIAHSAARHAGAESHDLRGNMLAHRLKHRFPDEIRNLSPGKKIAF